VAGSDADDNRPVTRRDVIELAELERKSHAEIDEADLRLELSALSVRVLQLELDRDNLAAQIRILTSSVASLRRR
jgi:hypothetical protein